MNANTNINWEKDRKNGNLIKTGEKLLIPDNRSSNNIKPQTQQASILPAQEGLAAHRALEAAVKEKLNKNVWFPEKRLNNGLKPDLIFYNNESGGVWELKPAPPSPSCVLAAMEALVYAGHCNVSYNTTVFAPGTQSGAPAPFNGVATQVFKDPKSNQIFEFYFFNTFGVIFWKNVTPSSETKKEPVNSPSPIPMPVMRTVPAPRLVPVIRHINPLLLLPMPCQELFFPETIPQQMY
jgi:hypothetical protein